MDEPFMETMTIARLVDGKAKLEIGSRTFEVSTRDRKDSPAFCPFELLTGALGS